MLKYKYKIYIFNRIKTYGYTNKQVNSLMKIFKTTLEEWQHKYLYTGSHLSPDNVADEIVFADRL